MKKFLSNAFILLITLILTASSLFCQDLGSYGALERFPNGISVKTSSGTLKVELVQEGIFRVSVLSEGHNSIPLSDGILPILIDPESIINFSVEENEDQIICSSLNYRLEISKQTLLINLFRNDELIFSEFQNLSISGDTTSLILNNLFHEIQGSGARPYDLNFQGKVFNMRNTYQGNYYENATRFEQSINTPLLFSNHKYALLMDSALPGRVRFDIGGFDSTKVVFRSIGKGDWSYFLVVGDNNDSILQNYTLLTGRQPLPPRWAFGILQSKQSYRTAQEVINIESSFDRLKLPLDAVFLDILWQSESGDLRFNEESFPNVETLISNNNNRGIKTIVRIDPLLSTRSSKFPFVQSNQLLATEGNSSQSSFFAIAGIQHALVDIYKAESKSYLKQNLEFLKKQGISGWWSENNEPHFVSNSAWVNGNSLSDNRNWYSHEWLKTVYKATAVQERLFILSRSAYVGSQRYGVIPRSGDVTRYWAGLNLQIPIMLHAGLSGFAYMHSDIGGFATDPSKNEKDDELDLRWLQLSVFSPIVRFHGLRNSTEAGRLSNPFLNAARDALTFRYKLLPYIYTLAYQNSLTGRPFCLPSNYFENTARLQNRNDQFYFGENLFVAPVLLHGLPIRRVDLPSGKWFNLWTAEGHEGGKAIFQELNLETIPVYAKAGAIVPLAQNEILHLEEYKIDSLEVLFFQDPTVIASTFEMYHDDGHTKTTNGKKITFDGISTNSMVSIRNSTTPLEVEHILYRFKNIKSIPKKIVVNGIENSLVFRKEELSTRSAFYDISNKELQVAVAATGEEVSVSFERDKNEVLLSTFLKEGYMLKVSPNPVEKTAVLEFSSNTAGNYLLKVSNIRGVVTHLEEIAITELGSRSLELDMTNFSAGTYFIRLISPKGIQSTAKVIKI